MSDGESFAAASSGKSEAEIAFELVNKLKGQGVWGEKNLGPILDMFAECLDAAKGLRAYPGQNRVDMPVKTPIAANTARASAPQVQAPIQARQVPTQSQAQVQAQVQAQIPAQVQGQAHPQPQQRAAAPQHQPAQRQQHIMQQAALKPG
jgi:DNA segregation ATPase FtsK/SpoIIIE-like protein